MDCTQIIRWGSAHHQGVSTHRWNWPTQFFFFLIMCNAGHTGRNADDLRTESVPLSLLYKPLQWLVHFSSFQFPSQYLINFIFFVHCEIGTHCKFWMQTIQEGKVWMQLCLPHKPFIFWWILVPGTDLCVRCTNNTQVTKDHPTNNLITDTFHLTQSAWFLHQLSSTPTSPGSDPVSPKVAREPDLTGLELNGALQT